MLRRKLATIILAAMITNMLSAPINASAQTVNGNLVQAVENNDVQQTRKATISKFNMYGSDLFESYNEKFKVDSSNIKSIKNNAGAYNSNSIIENAIDGKLQTYWETNNKNTSNFTNNIVVTFEKPEVLDRIVYAARRDAGYKGFPQEVEIYSSMTENEDDFKLVASGEYRGSKQDIVEIKFNATEFKRVKFVFKRVADEWASASELLFYREDKVMDKMNRIFTNESKNEVSPEFASLEKLNDFNEEAINHPFYSTISEYINNAKALIEGNNIKFETARVSKFKSFNDKALVEYDKQYKVPLDKVTSITTNGGKWSTNGIERAMDGDVNTNWHSNAKNSSTHTNEVVITLNELTKINRIMYTTLVPRGFAEEFEIYGSRTSEGDTFEKISAGKSTIITNDTLEIKFNETEVRRIKFVYKKAYEDWALAYEFGLYMKDDIDDKINDLFTDRTMSSLKEEYKNIDALNRLDDLAKSHPFYEDYKEKIELAKEILEKGNDVSSTVWSLKRRGNSIIEASKRKLWNFQDWQPTGYSVKAGDVINVYVDVKEGEPTPILVFKQMDRQDNGNTHISLVNGKNTITIPNTIGTPGRTSRPGVAPGGVLYTSNPYTEKEQSREPKIRIEGARNYPHYISGVDNDEEVMAELEAYVAEVKADPTLPDVFDVFSDKTLVNVRATYALDWYKSNNKVPSHTADKSESALRTMMDFYGIDGSSELNSDFNFRYITMIKFLNGGAFMNAANGITGVNLGSQGAILNYGMGWGLAHEMGHNFEFHSLSIQEVTNNMPALYFQYLAGVQSKISDQNLWNSRILPKVALDDNTNKEWYPQNDVSSLTHLAPLWQLQLYRKDFWPEYIKRAKVYQKDAPGHDGIHRGWIKVSCDALQLDLTEFFERHGAKVDEDVKEYASKYKKPDKKIWYINDKVYTNKGGAFTENLDYSISSIKQNGKNIELSFSMNDEDVKNTLGYEVYRDGKIIGFTSNNSYVDTSATSGVNHEYKIVAYDINIDPKGEASRKVFTPNISLKQNQINIPLNSEFNAKDYAKASNYLGEDISDRLSVEHNVNTSERGVYTVKYTVENKGITVEKSIDVNVVSKVDYLSDKKYDIKKSGWEGIKNDKAPAGNNISVLVNGEDIEFKKGIGAHAQSEIVFDISNEEYEYFYALIGLDKNVRNSGAASAKYKVLVDDKLAYESGAFGNRTDAEEIKINIKDAKKLTLITDINNGVDTADNTVWADAKFITSSSKPTIQAQNKSTKLGKEIDLKENVTAYDTEDGDLASEVEIIGDVNFNKTGKYNITYKVTDSDGNESTLERTIAVVDMNDYKYLSEYDWNSVKHNYTVPLKNQSISKKALRLTDENGQEVSYEKGIGAHSTSTIIYDLTDKNYDYFTSYVGVDREMYNSVGSVVFEVYVDGEKKFDSKVMRAKDKQQFVEVDINGAKELKLVVNNGGDNINSDHANWADAKLHYANNEGKEVDRNELDSLIKIVNELDSAIYREEGFANLKSTLEEVNNALSDGYNQNEIDELHDKLNGAYKALVKLADFKALQEAVSKASEIDKELYVEESIAKLEAATLKANEVLKDGLASQESVDLAVKELNLAISDLEMKVDLSKVVSITDNNLKQAIIKELSLTSNDVTIGDMYNLTELNATYSGIKSLQGLEYAKNLTSLNVNNNEIKDLSPLKNLKKLTDLQVKYQYIESNYAYDKGNKVTVKNDVVNKDGQSIKPRLIMARNNRASKNIKIDIEEAMDKDGVISFGTTDFETGVYTLYVVYEDDNYLGQSMTCFIRNK